MTLLSSSAAHSFHGGCSEAPGQPPTVWLASCSPKLGPEARNTKDARRDVSNVVTQELLKSFARRCDCEADHLSVRQGELLRWTIERVGPESTAEDLDKLMEELQLWLPEQDLWDLLRQEQRRLAGG